MSAEGRPSRSRSRSPSLAPTLDLTDQPWSWEEESETELQSEWSFVPCDCCDPSEIGTSPLTRCRPPVQSFNRDFARRPITWADLSEGSELSSLGTFIVIRQFPRQFLIVPLLPNASAAA